MKQQQPSQGSQLNKRRLGQSGMVAVVEVTAAKAQLKQQRKTGYESVVAYMEQLKPSEESEGASSWSKQQMAETPTLLPDLKFHDLVFGQNLGEGAFGSVRYARLIDRNKTRSNWAEFAVKVISTEKIQEFGYEFSVKREIAVLRMISHPGVARLVSSFRFREGAYLVLEYASGGDLHDLVRKKGSLDSESTRFVIGEVIAGLQSIHDLGLVHADLKAENILVTESGHIKLTDFGGCRPVTADAKEMIKRSAQTALRDLRNGDWKDQMTSAAGSTNDALTNQEGDTTMKDDIEEDEDGRLEGTTANLPPEIVLGGMPAFSTDSWALGCVMYQCLTGRPPLLESDEASTRTRIVQFATSAGDSQTNDGNVYVELFGATHAAGMEENARSLIRSLLERDVDLRSSVSGAAEHEFFNGMDVFVLYRQVARPLDVGQNAPSPTDAQWSRRQFSTIWAPQPSAYDVSPASGEKDQRPLSARQFSSPIQEGEEAETFFTPFSNRETIGGTGIVVESSGNY
jgi:serine/threonine protein kinase